MFSVLFKKISPSFAAYIGALVLLVVVGWCMHLGKYLFPFRASSHSTNAIEQVQNK